MLGQSASLFELPQDLFMSGRVLGVVFWLSPFRKHCSATNKLVMPLGSCKWLDSNSKGSMGEAALPQSTCSPDGESWQRAVSIAQERWGHTKRKIKGEGAAICGVGWCWNSPVLCSHLNFSRWRFVAAGLCWETLSGMPWCVGASRLLLCRDAGAEALAGTFCS